MPHLHVHFTFPSDSSCTPPSIYKQTKSEYWLLSIFNYPKNYVHFAPIELLITNQEYPSNFNKFDINYGYPILDFDIGNRPSLQCWESDPNK